MTLIATTITEALADCIRDCTAAKGYSSNVGATVEVGRLAAGATDAPCTYLLPGRGTGGQLYGVIEYTRAYELRAFVDRAAHPTIADAALVDLIIWDLRRIIERAPVPGVDALRFVSDQPGYREDGGNLVGAILHYEIIFQVSLSDPTTAL